MSSDYIHLGYGYALCYNTAMMKMQTSRREFMARLAAEIKL